MGGTSKSPRYHLLHSLHEARSLCSSSDGFTPLSPGHCEEPLHRSSSHGEIPVWLWDWRGEDPGEGQIPGGPHLRHLAAGWPQLQQAQWGTEKSLPFPECQMLNFLTQRVCFLCGNNTSVSKESLKMSFQRVIQVGRSLTKLLTQREVNIKYSCCSDPTVSMILSLHCPHSAGITVLIYGCFSSFLLCSCQNPLEFPYY